MGLTFLLSLWVDGALMGGLCPMRCWLGLRSTGAQLGYDIHNRSSHGWQAALAAGWSLAGAVDQSVLTLFSVASPRDLHFSLHGCAASTGVFLVCDSGSCRCVRPVHGSCTVTLPLHFTGSRESPGSPDSRERIPLCKQQVHHNQ